jgi:hypothetical protein
MFSEAETSLHRMELSVVAGRRDVEGKALEAELRGLGAEASFIKAGRLS